MKNIEIVKLLLEKQNIDVNLKSIFNYNSVYSISNLNLKLYLNS